MKNLNYLLISILTVLCFQSSLSAQKNYKKGYIITNSKDTIRGLIQFTSKSDYDKKCEIIRNGKTNSEFLTPNDIKNVKTNDSYFASKEVLLNNVRKKIFLEVLSEGIVNTYCLNNKKFFIEKGDSIYHLCTEEKEIIDKYGDKYSLVSNKYLGVLAFLFKEDPDINQKLGNTNLTSKLLVKITHEYCEKVCNNCKFINYRENQKHTIILEPHMAFNFSLLTFRGSNDVSTTLSPVIGVDIHFPSIRNAKWDYMLGINYSYNRFNGDYTHSIYRAVETYGVKLDYTFVSIPLLFEYSFNDKKIHPTLDFGYNNVFILSQNNSLTKLLNGSSIVEINSKMRLYQYGLIAGGGIKYKVSNNSSLNLKCVIEFRVSSINTHYFLDKQQTSSIQIKLGYSFKSN